jgi:hypothetical protein
MADTAKTKTRGSHEETGLTGEIAGIEEMIEITKK